MVEIFDEKPLNGAGDQLACRLNTVREWKILIVDSDETFHQGIVHTLSDASVLGHPLAFLHAHSASQAIDHLSANPDLAVLIFGRISEYEDAGLKLIRHIRSDLGLGDLRIILRSEQPGYSPDIDIICNYDIDDYNITSDLTRNGLFAALTSSIRSFERLRTLNADHRGMDRIVHASNRMITQQGITRFASDIISEIAGLLNLAPQGFVCSLDPESATGQTLIIAASGDFTQACGQSIDVLHDENLSALLKQAQAERQSIFGEQSVVLFVSGKSSCDLIAYFATGIPLDESSQQLIKVFCSNISINLENVELFDQLHDHAYNDQLLHIPNRLDFIRTVGNVIGSERLTKTVAVVDIDHFSQLNDALGHHYGDTLLQAVAERLIENLPCGTIVSRMAADTFGILGETETITPGALLTLFRTPFFIEGAEQTLSATIGLVRLSEVDGGGSEAVKSANIALNLAKSTSRGEGVFFTRSMEFETRARLNLLRELRSAFDREHLFLVYQPQFCLKTRRTIGMEALLRWRTDEGNYISPDQFIPLAENSGLIVGLGKWVLRTACHDLKRLVNDGIKDIRMAVNVSVMQFRHPGFIESVDEALRESGIDPGMLELEITESVAMLDANFMLGTLQQLKARGIAIAVDDFGTGFSSLSYLERLKVDRLKIDQSFVDQMLQSNSSLRIVETVVQLGHSLQLQIIAEGVEKNVQADLLERIGCHEAQGYLFARPMNFAQLHAFLKTSMQGSTAETTSFPLAPALCIATE